MCSRPNLYALVLGMVICLQNWTLSSLHLFIVLLDLIYTPTVTVTWCRVTSNYLVSQSYGVLSLKIV